MMGKNNRLPAFLLAKKAAYFFLFSLPLVFGAAGIYLFGQPGAPDTLEFDPSKVKISAQEQEKIPAVGTGESTSRNNEPPVQKSVCLDPGHGGIDPGAMKGKIWERDINLIAAKKVQTLLESKGYPVYLTRTTNNESLSKQDRYSFCNSKNASILVAVHHNTYEDGAVNYTTALYYSKHDHPLAQSIAQSVSAALKTENKGIAWFDNSVLSKAAMPAVFSEAFFITNSTEYARLAKKDYSRLDKEAEGIVDGIINYFTDPYQFKPTFASEELKIDRTDW